MGMETENITAVSSDLNVSNVYDCFNSSFIGVDNATNVTVCGGNATTADIPEMKTAWDIVSIVIVSIILGLMTLTTIVGKYHMNFLINKGNAMRSYAIPRMFCTSCRVIAFLNGFHHHFDDLNIIFVFRKCICHCCYHTRTKSSKCSQLFDFKSSGRRFIGCGFGYASWSYI